MWLGQPRAAVNSLEHALSRTANPIARSLLFLRKARAHAMLHEAPACYRDLAQAEKLLDSTTETAPPWCSWMGQADLAVAGLPKWPRPGLGRTYVASSLASRYASCRSWKTCLSPSGLSGCQARAASL